MSSLDCWWLGLRLWVSKIDIFYKHRPSFPSQSSILAYGSKTLYSRSSQLPLPCSALSCHFNHTGAGAAGLKSKIKTWELDSTLSCVLCPVFCVLCPVSTALNWVPLTQNCAHQSISTALSNISLIEVPERKNIKITPCFDLRTQK